MTYRFIGCGARTGSILLSTAKALLPSHQDVGLSWPTSPSSWSLLLCPGYYAQGRSAISRDSQHKLNDERLFPGPLFCSGHAQNDSHSSATTSVSVFDWKTGYVHRIFSASQRQSVSRTWKISKLRQDRIRVNRLSICALVKCVSLYPKDL